MPLPALQLEAVLAEREVKKQAAARTKAAGRKKHQYAGGAVTIEEVSDDESETGVVGDD